MKTKFESDSKLLAFLRDTKTYQSGIYRVSVQDSIYPFRNDRIVVASSRTGLKLIDPVTGLKYSEINIDELEERFPLFGSSLKINNCLLNTDISYTTLIVRIDSTCINLMSRDDLFNVLPKHLIPCKYEDYPEFFVKNSNHCIKFPGCPLDHFNGVIYPMKIHNFYQFFGLNLDSFPKDLLNKLEEVYES